MTARALAIAGLAAAAMFGRPALAAPPAAPGEPFPVATAVRLGGDDQQTRMVVDFDRKVDAAAFTLADPYRVVLDLPQVAFKLPQKAGEQGRGLVKAFRYGLIMQGGSRIVLDVKSPVRVDKAFTLPAADGQPARLVIDMSPTDRDSFLRNISLENRSLRSPHIKQAEAVPKDTGDPRPLIVIDPGHGGVDSGTKSYDGKIDEDVGDVVRLGGEVNAGDHVGLVLLVGEGRRFRVGGLVGECIDRGAACQPFAARH